MKKTSRLVPIVPGFSLRAVLYIANDMYLPAMPTIGQELHATTDQVQLTLTLFFMSLALCYPFIGPLSDRFGRRTMVMIGLIIFVITNMGCMLSGSIEQLIFWRFLQGSSIAFVVVAGYATIHERYDQLQAIMILAWMGSITILAPAFGPIIGSGILLFAGWRKIFLMQIVWGILGLAAIYSNMPQENTRHHPESLQLSNVLRTYKNILQNPGSTLNTLAFTGLFSGFIAWIAAGAFHHYFRLSLHTDAIWSYSVCDLRCLYRRFHARAKFNSENGTSI